jgi:hypothetical protein
MAEKDQPKPKAPAKEHEVIQFPKKYTPPPDKGATRTRLPCETKKAYHDEVFEYEDGSYVVLVQPRKQKFTIERMVFMAERLKMTLFDALPCFDEDDIALELEPDPSKPA